MTNRDDATVYARQLWRTLEPYHGMIYFVPEAEAAYEELGVTGRSGYFGSRSAAMGAVGPLVVQATFFNFHPRLVESAMAGLWDRTTPEAMLLARHRAVDAALRRLLGDEVEADTVQEAVDLVRPAVEAASARPEGRPLFAGHARLPEPDVPHLALWWAITLLREFRGDGHIAALVDAELSGVEALVLHAATGTVPRAVLQATRAWSDDEWEAAVERLRSRGLVEDGPAGPDDTDRTDGEVRLSPAGTELHDHIEHRTDVLATPAWGAISAEDAARVRAIVRPWSKTIAATAFGSRVR